MVNKNINKEYLIIKENIKLIESALISLNKEIISLRKKYMSNFFEEDLKKLMEKEKEFYIFINDLKKWKKELKSKIWKNENISIIL